MWRKNLLYSGSISAQGLFGCPHFREFLLGPAGALDCSNRNLKQKGKGWKRAEIFWRDKINTRENNARSVSQQNEFDYVSVLIALDQKRGHEPKSAITRSKIYSYMRYQNICGAAHTVICVIYLFTYILCCKLIMKDVVHSLTVYFYYENALRTRRSLPGRSLGWVWSSECFKQMLSIKRKLETTESLLNESGQKRNDIRQVLIDDFKTSDDCSCLS